jgi:hypothetical protein
MPLKSGHWLPSPFQRKRNRAKEFKKLYCSPPKTTRQRMGQGGRSEQVYWLIALTDAWEVGRAFLFNTRVY